MSTNVYVNNREACSKAANGKSTAAFPDPCWSPPNPPAGPIVVPYPNTAYARDLANGTSTVFICGSMVAQADTSYFAKSIGDQGATESLPKGVATGAIEGKAYFISWSHDVMFEGKGVPRHEDLMTHNHASDPGNTPPHIYMDSDAIRRDCSGELKKVQDACKKTGDDKVPKHAVLNKFLSPKTLQKLDQLEGDIKKKLESNSDTAWMEHCTGLWIKPSGGVKDVIDKFNSLLKDMTSDFKDTVKNMLTPLVDKVKAEVEQKVGQAAAKRGAELGERALTRWGVGAVAGGGIFDEVTEIGATAWNAYDWASTAYQGYQLSKEAYKAVQEIGDIKDMVGQASKELEALASDAAKMSPTQAMATGMGVLSRFNACTRARRCILVTYDETKAPKNLNGKGCCPGQTGHHILPDEMTKGGRCPGYDKNSAPTVCVEGTNNNNGSHGLIHKAMAIMIKDHTSGLFGSNTLSYEKARDYGIRSIRDTFPESQCSRKCLKTQLDSYYRSKCNQDLPAVSGSSGGGGQDDSATDTEK